MDGLTYTAFSNNRRIASGDIVKLLTDLKPWVDEHPGDLLFIFDNETGKAFDFDFRGDLKYVIERVVGTQRSGPGRPKMGVVSREVSLLPRHWDWLEQRPNGASATLRRLVDEARKQSGSEDARTRTVRVMTALAGDLAGYEEASRALYRGDRVAFEKHIHEWPSSVYEYVLEMAEPALL